MGIINGGIECSSGHENPGSTARGSYYTSLLEYFDLPKESELGCASLKPFTTQSAGAYEQNFQAGNSFGTCKVVSWTTQYSYFRKDDYKRCVCDTWAPRKANCLGKSSIELEDEETDNRECRGLGYECSAYSECCQDGGSLTIVCDDGVCNADYGF